MANEKKIDNQAKNSAATYNNNQAGNTPAGQPGSKNGDVEPQSGNAEQQAEIKGEKINNPQPVAKPKSAQKGGKKDIQPSGAYQVSDEPTDEERAEFQRLKTKRHNMPLSSEDIDRYDTLKLKIEG